MNRGESKKYKRWREAILKKYEHKCVNCNSPINLHVHHVKSWHDYPSLRYDINNGTVLCDRCHINIHPFSSKYYKKSRKGFNSLFRQALYWAELRSYWGEDCIHAGNRWLDEYYCGYKARKKHQIKFNKKRAARIEKNIKRKMITTKPDNLEKWNEWERLSEEQKKQYL